MIRHPTIPPSDALRYPCTSILGDENVPNVSICVFTESMYAVKHKT